MIRKKIMAYGACVIYVAMLVLINSPFIGIGAIAIFIGVYCGAWILSFSAGEPLHQWLTNHWLFFSSLFALCAMGMIFFRREQFQIYTREVRAFRQSREYNIPSLAEPVSEDEIKRIRNHKKIPSWKSPPWKPRKRGGESRE